VTKFGQTCNISAARCQSFGVESEIFATEVIQATGDENYENVATEKESIWQPNFPLNSFVAAAENRHRPSILGSLKVQMGKAIYFIIV